MSLGSEGLETVMATVDEAIRRCPKWLRCTLCLLATLLLIWLQKGVGRTTLSPLYAIPISLLAWYDGVLSAIALSAITLLGGIAVAYINYGPPTVMQAFGGLARIVFFGFLSVVLPRLHYLQNHLEELANERGRALANEVAARRTLERELLDTAERDQRGIGRDLHDGLSQHLIATAMVSYAHAQTLALLEQPEVERARKIVDLIEQSITLARSISKGLHPIEMGGDALMHGLEELALTTSELFGIRCRLDCQLPVIVDNPTTAMHLFRIVQEAVSNSIRHGRATEIEISLSESDSGINVVVVDNGVGVPTPPPNRNGLGLHIMAARAKFIGGRFSLGRKMNGGTELVCQVPFS